MHEIFIDILHFNEVTLDVVEVEAARESLVIRLSEAWHGRGCKITMKKSFKIPVKMTKMVSPLQRYLAQCYLQSYLAPVLQRYLAALMQRYLS